MNLFIVMNKYKITKLQGSIEIDRNERKRYKDSFFVILAKMDRRWFLTFQLLDVY